MVGMGEKKQATIEKRRLGLVTRIRKQIDKFALTNADLGFTTN